MLGPDTKQQKLNLCLHLFRVKHTIGASKRCVETMLQVRGNDASNTREVMQTDHSVSRAENINRCTAIR